MAQYAKTQAKIEKETARLDALLAEKKAIETKIKEQTATIEALNRQLESEKLGATSQSLIKMGVSLDMLCEAAEKGDFSAIQEILKGGSLPKTAPTEDESTDNDDNSSEDESTEDDDVENNA